MLFFRPTKVRSTRPRRLLAESLESRRLLAGDSDVFALFQTADLAIERAASRFAVGRFQDTAVLLDDFVFHELNVRVDEAPMATFDQVVSPDVDFVETTAAPEAIDHWASVTPQFIDEFDEPVSSVMVGETVWLEVTIDDIGEFASRGIFSAYFDLDFGDADVALAGSTEFNSGYSFLRRDPATYGWQAIGAVDSNWFTPDPDAHWLVRIPVQFGSADEINLQLNSPDDWVQHATLIYGNDELTPVDAVDFGQTSLTVIGSTVDDMTPIAENAEAVGQTESDPPMSQTADQTTDAVQTNSSITNQPLPLTSNDSDDDDDNLPNDQALSLF